MNRRLGFAFAALSVMAGISSIFGAGYSDQNSRFINVPELTISAVAASRVSSGGATISWATDKPSDSQVEYGTSTTYGRSTAVSTAMNTAHAQNLTGLAPNTIYHYRVKSKDSGGNLACSGDFSFTTASDTTPPAISAITASGIAPLSVRISWTTDENADSQVEYGTSTSYGSSTGLDAPMAITHAINLAGLAPNTAYHYRVKSRDASGNVAVSGDFTFTTSADGAVMALHRKW